MNRRIVRLEAGDSVKIGTALVEAKSNAYDDITLIISEPGSCAARMAKLVGDVMPSEPSGWHVGFDKRELAEALTERMGWKRSSYGVVAIYSNPMNTEQIADVLGALDQRDAEIRRLRHLLRSFQPVPDGGNCAICGDTGHQASECHHIDPRFAQGPPGLHPSTDEQAAAYAEASTCLYCGLSPCRCDEVNAVADGLKRHGVAITD